MGRFDMIYFAIPEDGKGPSFGPVLDREVAQTRADAMPGYVVGIDINYIGWSALPEDARE
jgi:hypothetical protein